MAWPPTRANGFVLDADALNEIINALRGWGGDVNGNGYDLANVGNIFLAAGAAIIGAPPAPAVGPITVTTSPQTVTNSNSFGIVVYISGGVLDLITKNGVSLGDPPRTITLAPGASFTMTFSAAPTLISDRFFTMAEEGSTTPITFTTSPQTVTNSSPTYFAVLYLSAGVVNDVQRHSVSLGDRPGAVFLLPGESADVYFDPADPPSGVIVR